MFDAIKEKLRRSPAGLYILEYVKKVLYEFYLVIYNDEKFIRKLYKKKISGQTLNLDNPEKFTEKQQWLKLYYRDPKIPICSDKIEAKKYVAKRGYSNIIIPTYFTYNSPDGINLEQLPDHFIIKASHGSSWNIICRGDKNKINWVQAKKTMKVWLKSNLYIYGREWNYKNQKPRLLAEKLLSSECVIDYKFLCFNGIPKIIAVSHDLDGYDHYLDFYNMNWQKITLQSGTHPSSNITMPKPKMFDYMAQISKDLSEPFPFVRIDLYEVEQKVFFGEMTFFPASGFWKLNPPEYDLMFGKWLTLPK